MAQSYANLEILVIDNASADNTGQVMQAFMAGDPRVRYLKHAENIGMIGNFNACIESARGEYIKFICADDLLSPDCVTRMVGVMTAQSEISLVACARQLMDERLKPISLARYAASDVSVDGKEAIRRCFFHGNLIGEPTAVMFRSKDAVHGFNPTYPQLLDLEMWFRLLRIGGLAFLAAPLCAIRKHADQATDTNMRSGAVLGDKRRLFCEFLAEAGQHASVMERALWDARMGVTIRRTKDAGHAVSPGEINEVFFPRLFGRLTYPLASALWRLMPGRI